MSQRVLHCPECGRRYQIDQERVLGRDLLVLCGSCEAVFTPDLKLSAAVVSQTQPVSASVLVAHESPAVSAAIGRAVRSADYWPRYVSNGAAALAAFDSTLLDVPKALVLDVALPNVLAFEVVDAIRKRPALSELPIILLASVYDPTRYKRRPGSLYGANSYLELHHVPDRLPLLLRKFIDKEEPQNDYRGHLPQERANAEAIKAALTASGDDQARVIARRIVSDLALYNEQELIAGLKHGDLDRRLAEVLAEGREIYQNKCFGIENIAGDPYEEAMLELTESVKKRLA